jgi:hypothetical protein
MIYGTTCPINLIITLTDNAQYLVFNINSTSSNCVSGGYGPVLVQSVSFCPQQLYWNSSCLTNCFEKDQVGYCYQSCPTNKTFSTGFCCSPNCGACISETCSSCSAGDYTNLAQNACFDCPPYTEVCYQINNVLISQLCGPSYFLSNGSCTPCPIGCQYCGQVNLSNL